MTDESPKTRPGGRPRVDEPRASVGTWLSASEHDRLIRLAAASDLSVSALMRELVRRATGPDRDGGR